MLSENKIILTGGSGFIGREIIATLNDYNIVTISRTSGDILSDLAVSVPELPDSNLVIHCAGKAHSVPKSAAEKKVFFDVNVTGTLNLLKGLERQASLPKSFVLISTVAVYGAESGNFIDESHPLNATDAYGESKKQAESLVEDWCNKHNVVYAVLRLPLVAGPNPPGNLGSMISGMNKGYYFNIAGGTSKKSIVLAKDVAMIIPKAAKIGGIYNLTDGYHPSFSELANKIASQLGKPKPRTIPRIMAVILAEIGNLVGPRFPFNSRKLQKITSDLTFDDSKARSLLGWSPTAVLDGIKVK